MNKAAISLIVLAGISFLTLVQAAFIVRETDQVMVLRFGEPQRQISEPGLNFMIPFVDTASYFDKRVLDYDAIAQEVPTADQKQLIVDAYARYRITNPLQFFTTVRTERQLEDRLNALISSALRQVLGEVQLAVIMTPERARIIDQFTAIVASGAQGFGVEVVDVRLKRIDLPQDNSEAIFRRMGTQREQEARLVRAEGDKEARRIRAEADKKQRVIVAEAKRDAEILRGQGDGEAQRLYNESYGKNVVFFDFWRSMQAMQKGLAGDTTTYVGPPDSDFFRYFRDETGATPKSQPQSE